MLDRDNVKLRIGVFLIALVAVRCGSEGPTQPTPRQPPIAPGARTAVLVGAGDIGVCGSPGAAATGQLVESSPGEVFLAGDIAYPHGSAANFSDCFEPVWGHARERWHAVPGNHEYESPGALPFFQFFGGAAGPPGFGYHRFIAGEWLVIMINSEIATAAGSPQYEFVRLLLESRPFRCQIAIWHKPLFSSGPNGPHPHMRDMWQLLDLHHVDAVVNGHDHLYERFSRQDADGRPSENGIRQFTVGTGGADLYDFVRVAPNSATRISRHGVIRLTLHPDTYDWSFLQTDGVVGDSGFTVCH